MKNDVNISQFSLLLMLVVTGGKFLSLPAILAGDVGHDSWLVLCVAFLLDLLCLCFLLWAIRLNKHSLSLDQILDATLSKVVEKIVLAIFLVIFLCRTIFLLDSCYNAFAVTFDVNTNWVLFVLPIVALCAFTIHRGFNSLARVSEILFGLIIVSVVAILIYPATQTEFSSLLPVGECGTWSILRTAFNRSFWFSDYIFVYFVLEDLKVKKHLFSPVIVAFVSGAALTVVLNIVFLSLFGELAPANDLAMSKIGLFSVSESTDGRWDWLTLSVWLMSVIIKIVVFVFCAYKCVEKLVEKPFQKLNFWVIFGIFSVLMLPMFLPVSTLLNTFVVWCLVPFAAVQFLLPLIMPLITNSANKKSEKNNE